MNSELHTTPQSRVRGAKILIIRKYFLFPRVSFRMRDKRAAEDEP